MKFNISHKTKKLFILSGIIGPIIYFTIMILLGFFEPGYDHISQSMSELGAMGANYAIIMNTLGFPLLGFLLICFTIGLHYTIPTGKLTLLGPCLIIISNISLILTGVFRCDPGCVDITIVGVTHSIFATIAAILMMISPIALTPRIYKDPVWSRYIWFFWVISIMTSIFSLFYTLPSFEAYNGILQKISMGIPLFWIEVMAVRLFRLSMNTNQ
ncbi:MAG: DUF998 domain-containing protein [Promethearchaeota archaeon]